MRHSYLDRYSHLASPVHRLPAGLKLAAVVALLLGTIAVPPPAPLLYAGTAIVLALVAVLSRIPPLYLLQRLLFLEPIALGVASLSLLRPGGTGLFFGLMARSTVSLFAVILLANTTPFTAVLATFRRLHVPRLVITILALMYRYLFLLVDEAERMQRARTSRTFGRSRKRIWKTQSMLVGRLFVRSTERAERIYAAMCARGWK